MGTIDVERRDQNLGFVLVFVFRAVGPRLSVTVRCPEVRYLKDTVVRLDFVNHLGPSTTSCPCPIKST